MIHPLSKLTVWRGQGFKPPCILSALRCSVWQRETGTQRATSNHPQGSECRAAMVQYYECDSDSFSSYERVYIWESFAPHVQWRVTFWRAGRCADGLRYCF